jgi:putative hemolysin
VLTAVLRRVRSDVRLLGNRLLARVPELVPLCVFVDVFGSADCRRDNGRRLVGATRWLESGGTLIVFPAGEVSHRRSLRGDVRDPAWREGAARLAAAAQATVLPVHITGANCCGCAGDDST